jgi:D-glycero-alpha-D-manno-heptose 1-phosphate guanylyltransferase
MEYEFVVLAGGFGTRLQSILNGLPKPLADINGTPFIKYLLQNWIKQGVKNFVFSLYYESKLIINLIEEEKNNLLENCNIRYVVEPNPLGTGGAIAYAIKECKIKNNFLVANADTWLSSGVNEISLLSRNTLAAVNIQNSNRYGKIAVNEKNIITNFLEKNIHSTSGYINAGLYKLNPNQFNNWDGQPFSLETDLFPRLVSNSDLFAMKLETEFIDIGIPDDYFKFCEMKLNDNLNT